MKGRLTTSILLKDRIYSFHRDGYVVLRNESGAPKDYTEKLGQLKTSILTLLARQRLSVFYGLWRLWNQVSVSTNRYTLPLPLDSQVLEILRHSIGLCRPYLDSKLSTLAELVEVNAIVTFPGALVQDVHSDIPYSGDNMLISGFIALSEVGIQNGPTYLYAGSHSRRFHESLHLSRDRQSTYYSSDGSMEEPMAMINEQVINDHALSLSGSCLNSQSEGSDSCRNTDSDDTNHSTICHSEHHSTDCHEANRQNQVHQQHHHNHPTESVFHSLTPIHFHLQAGDILLFNSMIFHFGAANSSVEPRPLLSFSFQNIDPATKRLVHIDGFTYHSHYSIRNAHLTIQDFSPVVLQ